MFKLKHAVFAVSVASLSVNASAQKSEDRLHAGFLNPPQAARPQVWWHWMNGNVSQAGAELDLAWLKQMGIGGVHIFSGALLESTVVSPPVSFMSPEWKSIFRSAMTSARASGMEVTIAGSPGWSETGGTWVAPEDAMKKYVWSETSVEGGAPFRGKLVQPPSATGPYQGLQRKRSDHIALELTHDVYRDSVVLAYPTPRAASEADPPVITSNSSQFDSALATPFGTALPTQLAAGSDGSPAYLQAAYARTVTVRAVTVGLSAPADIDILAEDEAGNLHSILKVPADRTEQPASQTTLSFTPVKSKLLRVQLSPDAARSLPGLPKGVGASMPKTVSLTRIAFHQISQINRFEAKAGFASTVDFASNPTPEADPASVVHSADVIDLTSHLAPDGTLLWSPPAGKWTILRIGYSLTGQTNAPAEASATGLEVDKLDAALVRKYMEHYLSLYDDASGGALGQGGIQNVLTDSWEAGVQNWTPTMLMQLKNRCGYDPVRFLPTLAGWVVDDAQTSDRFLYDFHRSLKDMLADNHYGTLAKVLHEHHMRYYTEAEGDYPRAIGDGMTMKSRADIPTGEFWYRPFSTDSGQPPLKADLEEAASAAHVYGKPFAASESLTVGAFADPWSFAPGMLKPVADEIFAHGINRILLHESHLQPFVDRKPGLELGLFGQYFNRNETWAQQARPWVDYLARTSFLLQQGRFNADVAMFYGEQQNLSERYLHSFNEAIPKGYGYDYINPEALFTLLSVKNGKIVTPSGMSYRLLYLPSYVDRLSLPAARKMQELVAAGAVLVGAKPKGGLGLRDSDQAVRALCDLLWGTVSDDAPMHRFGKGRVYATADLALALQHEALPPEVAVTTDSADSNIMTVRRSTAEQEIVFVSNQKDRSESLTVRSRWVGMAPEIWHAEDGKVSPVGYTTDKTGTASRFDLHPYEAIFLIYHRSKVRSREVRPEVVKDLQAVSGPWEVRFEAGRGAPSSAVLPGLKPWNESEDRGIKYFSGHATYRKTLDVAGSVLQSGSHLTLDLGEVREIAEVSINGSAPVTLWHAPYAMDATGLLKPGSNEIRITVTNLWPNRMIGDRQPGATKYTYAPQSPYGANSPLLRSGLMGPVRLLQRVRDVDVTSKSADLH